MVHRGVPEPANHYRVRRPAGEWRRWATAFSLISLAEGIGWGWATLWLATGGSFEIDLLVVGNCALRKKDQDQSLARDYRDEFEPD